MNDSSTTPVLHGVLRTPDERFHSCRTARLRRTTVRTWPVSRACGCTTFVQEHGEHIARAALASFELRDEVPANAERGSGSGATTLSVQ